MAKKNLDNEVKLSAEQKLIGKVSDFFVKYRIALVIVIVCIVVGLIAGIIGVNVSKSAKEKAQINVYNLEQEYNELRASETPDWNAFISKANGAINGSSYSSVKAAYLVGLAYYDVEDYANAQAAFEKVYSLNTKIYMAPLALCNAAACADAQGNTSKALEYYNQVASDYSESGVAPRALFNAGRIYYQQGNMQLAKATFEQVADYYANSEYGMMATNIANVL